MLLKKTPLCLLFAALLANVADEAVWRACGPSLFHSAMAASGSQGPDLGVNIIRSGADRRPLVALGQAFTVSVGVNNLRGFADAHQSILTVRLPAALALQSASPLPDRSEGSSVLIWNLGTLEAGAFPRLFELNLNVAADTSPSSQFSISADVATSDREDNLKNNTGRLTILVARAVAELSVQSDLDAVALTPGNAARFMVEVTSLGTVAAAESGLNITLPAGISLAAAEPSPKTASGSKLTWSLGDIEPASTRTIIVTVNVDKRLTPTLGDPASSAVAPLQFELVVSGPATGPNAAQDRLVVDKRIELAGHDLKLWLAVEGSDEPGELTVGRDVDYVINYGNFGNQLAQAATVKLTLPPGLSLLKSEPATSDAGAKDTATGRPLSWNIGDLPVGESRIIRAHVHVASVSAEGARVTAVISAEGQDTNPDNNKAESLRRAARTESKMTASQAVDSPASRRESSFRWVWWVAAIGTIILVVIAGAMIRSSRNKDKSSPAA